MAGAVRSSCGSSCEEHRFVQLTPPEADGEAGGERSTAWLRLCGGQLKRVMGSCKILRFVFLCQTNSVFKLKVEGNDCFATQVHGSSIKKKDLSRNLAQQHSIR